MAAALAITLLGFVAWQHDQIVAFLGTLVGAIFACLGSVALAIVVHEVGHAVGGWLAGMRLRSLYLGPIQLHARQTGGYSVNLRNSSTTAVESTPTQATDARRQLIALTVAGPVANCIVAALVLWLYLRGGYGSVERPEWTADMGEWGPWLFAIFLELSIFSSTAFFLGNLVPFHDRGITTDGAKLLTLLRGGPICERLVAISSLCGVNRTYGSLAHWDPALIKLATAEPDDSAEYAAGNYIAYLWALDQSEVSRAGTYLDIALEHAEFAPFLRPAILTEAAFFIARYRNDVARARELLLAAHSGALDAALHLRASAAIALAAGDSETAVAQAQSALGLLNERPDPNLSSGGIEMADSERRWLEDIIEAAAVHRNFPRPRIIAW